MEGEVPGGDLAWQVANALLMAARPWEKSTPQALRVPLYVEKEARKIPPAVKLGHSKRQTLTGPYNLMLHFEFVVLSKLFFFSTETIV